jgi:hypothetical protein
MANFGDGKAFDLLRMNLNRDQTVADARVDYATYAAGALPATTGMMTVALGAYDVHTLTPTGNCTLNASVGVSGQRATILVATSGTVSCVITPGTGFGATGGTLTTGTVTAKTFAWNFATPDGTNWIETSRTTAM